MKVISVPLHHALIPNGNRRWGPSNHVPFWTLAATLCGLSHSISLLRNGEPTRTDDPWFGGYTYDVRFYYANDSEAAEVAASIRKEGSQPQYRLDVTVAHHTEAWWVSLDGDPSETHLESLSLEFNFGRRIEMVPLPLWLLTPAYPFPSNISGSFSLQSKMDIETGVLLLNFTRLRNLEQPPSSPVRWSWISFQFLMTPEPPQFPPESPGSAEPPFDAFTLTISFTLHLPSGGKVMYEKGTTALGFQRPVGAALREDAEDRSVLRPLLNLISATKAASVHVQESVRILPVRAPS